MPTPVEWAQIFIFGVFPTIIGFLGMGTYRLEDRAYYNYIIKYGIFLPHEVVLGIIWAVAFALYGTFQTLFVMNSFGQLAYDACVGLLLAHLLLLLVYLRLEKARYRILGLIAAIVAALAGVGAFICMIIADNFLTMGLMIPYLIWFVLCVIWAGRVTAIPEYTMAAAPMMADQPRDMEEGAATEAAYVQSAYHPNGAIDHTKLAMPKKNK